MAAHPARRPQPSQRNGPATLADLAEQGLDLFCWCNRCCHHATLAVGPLIGQMGPAMPVPAAGARLRCTGCGGRDIATRPAWRGPGPPIGRHT